MRMAFKQNGDGYVTAGAVPIGSLLPAVFQEYDENALRFTAALDQVLAPVWLSIDCFDAYLSPVTSPDDVAAWLAGWVGVVVDDNWQPDQLRRLITGAFELYRWRGTVKGIADLVEAYTGLRPEVEDSGGVAVSATARDATASRDDPTVVVRVSRTSLRDPNRDLERLTSLVRVSAPVHVAARVELT